MDPSKEQQSNEKVQQMKEIQENIKKLAEKVGDSRTGGKGSQRRKVKVVHKTQITDDKKLKTIIKKFGVQPFQGIDEVNMFKDDKSVLHFTKPEVLASLQNNTFVVIGQSETKSIKDLLPDILQHLGPKQFNYLKDFMSQGAKDSKQPETIPEKENDDEVPTLSTNFEEVSKVD